MTIFPDWQGVSIPRMSIQILNLNAEASKECYGFAVHVSN